MQPKGEGEKSQLRICPRMHVTTRNKTAKKLEYNQLNNKKRSSREAWRSRVVGNTTQTSEPPQYHIIIYIYIYIFASRTNRPIGL